MPAPCEGLPLTESCARSPVLLLRLLLLVRLRLRRPWEEAAEAHPTHLQTLDISTKSQIARILGPNIPIMSEAQQHVCTSVTCMSSALLPFRRRSTYGRRRSSYDEFECLVIEWFGRAALATAMLGHDWLSATQPAGIDIAWSRLVGLAAACRTPQAVHKPTPLSCGGRRAPRLSGSYLHLSMSNLSISQDAGLPKHRDTLHSACPHDGPAACSPQGFACV